jgi:hypothetical protein
MMLDVGKIINSLKGISGSGNVLAQAMKAIKEANLTLEPGDFARSNIVAPMAAPIGYDLWYLFAHDNFMSHYYAEVNQDLKDYQPYLDDCFDFLKLLPGLKPLRVLRNLEQFISDTGFDAYSMTNYINWTNNGIYWVNTAAFELWEKGLGAQYPSDGPKDFNPNDYVGYLSFPVGQLGVMEVMSLIQETKISGYLFAGKDGLPDTIDKQPIDPATLEDKFKPITKTPTEIFSPNKDINGVNHAGQNYCYGRHLIESAYLLPKTPEPSQNTSNSEGTAAYAPTANRDVEPHSSPMAKYLEEVKPKLWMRYWIHKDSTMPVPGEFIGILCKPVAIPPHVWWFQESTPFLYAGNWMETGNLTSGEVIAVTREADRPEGSIGDEYSVLIQGCMVTIYPSDFLSYEVGDRVAILKVDSTTTKADKSFTWLDQVTFKDTDEGTVQTKHIIIPATFYKTVH